MPIPVLLFTSITLNIKKKKEDFVPQLGNQPLEHYLNEDHQTDLDQHTQRVYMHLSQWPHRNLQPEKNVKIAGKFVII